MSNPILAIAWFSLKCEGMLKIDDPVPF